jgi:hypothetical protein
MLEVFVVILDPWTSEPQSNVDVEARKQSDGTIIAVETTNVHGVATFTALSDDATFHARTWDTPPLYQVTHGGRGGLVNVDYVVDSGGRGTHTALFGASGALEAAIATGADRTIWVCTTHVEAVAATHALTNLASGQRIVVLSSGRNRPVISVAAGLGTDALIDHGTANSGGAEEALLRFEGLAFKRDSGDSAGAGQFLTGNGGYIFPDLELYDVTFEGDSWTYLIDIDTASSANAHDITLEKVHTDAAMTALFNISTLGAPVGRLTIRECDFAALTNIQRRTNSTDVDMGRAGILIENNLFRSVTGYGWTRTYTTGDWELVFAGNIVLDYSGSASFIAIGTNGTLHPLDATISGNYIRCSNVAATTRAVTITGAGGGTARNISIVGNALRGPGGANAHIAIAFDLANTDCAVLNSYRDWDTNVGGTVGPGSGTFTGDHGTLLGLGDDDHTIYLLADGSRALTGNWAPGAFDIGNYDFTAKVEKLEIDDANFALDIVSSNPRILADVDDYYEYNRASNYHSWGIGSTEYFRVGGTSQLDFFNGSILETTRIVVSSDGATVTLALDQAGGGDLTLVFSDGFTTFDTTPAVTVSLTAGGDTSPQTNYVYILQSNKTLTVSTSGWPSEEHAPIAIVILQSAATTQTENALVVHLWHDHVQGSDEQGHYSHLGRWIRQHSATYESGVAQTLTITTNAGAPDNVDFATTAGEVYQMHLHVVPAFNTATGTNVHVVNDSVSPYTPVTDLADLLTDSAGGSMSGKYFNLVIWASVSEETDETHLFINLPSGSYNKLGDAIDDVSGFTNFTIPDDFKGTAFLISRLTLRHQAASGGTWTSEQETDLRGLIPNLVAGGGTSAITTEFADNAFKLFDESDVTKLLEFQLSGITTGNTRTLTVPDGSGTLLLATGLAGSQTLIGGTASGEDLTLQSTAHATRGSIFLGSSSEFELDESSGQLRLPTSGGSAGLLIGGDVLLAREGANLAVFGTGDRLLMRVDSATALEIRTAGDTPQLAMNTSVGQLQLPITGSGAGLLIGGDALLYRDGNDELRTPDAFRVDTYMAIGAALDENVALTVRRTWTDAAASHSGWAFSTFVQADGTGATRIIGGWTGTIVSDLPSKANILGGLNFQTVLGSLSGGATLLYGTRVSLSSDIGSSGTVDEAFGYELVQGLAGGVTLDLFTGYHCPDVSALATDASSNIFGFRADAFDASATPNRYPFFYGDVGTPLFLVDAAGNIQLHSNTELRFYDNGNYVGFEAPALAADQIWVLPSADGNANEALVTDAGGNLSWADLSGIAGGAHAILDGSIHSDSVADGVTAGSIIIGNDTPKWDELVIAIPAANVRNVLGIDNGETVPSWKTALDATNPAVLAAGASPGTSLVFSHRDHVHPYHASHGVTHNDVHGISKHTEHATWKMLYTDGSGDEQELSLPADGLALVGAGTTAAPVFEAIYTTHIAEFPALAEDLETGVMGGRPGKCVGESGEHGAFTAIRAKAIAGTAGTGTTTILIEADDNPAFSSATTLFTLALNTSTEVDDTVLDNAWASGDIFIRARCSAVGATAPKDVNVFFYWKEQAENF